MIVILMLIIAFSHFAVGTHDSCPKYATPTSDYT